MKKRNIQVLTAVVATASGVAAITGTVLSSPSFVCVAIVGLFAAGTVNWFMT